MRVTNKAFLFRAYLVCILYNLCTFLVIIYEKNVRIDIEL